jgi:hypothetical protein
MRNELEASKQNSLQQKKWEKKRAHRESGAREDPIGASVTNDGKILTCAGRNSRDGQHGICSRPRDGHKHEVLRR